MILLVLGAADILHLIVVIVVKFVVSRFLLSEVDVEIFGEMIFLDAFLHLVEFEEFLVCLVEIKVGGGSGLLCLHDVVNGGVEGLRFGQCLVGFGVAEVHCASDLVDFRSDLSVMKRTL